MITIHHHAKKLIKRHILERFIPYHLDRAAIKEARSYIAQWWHNVTRFQPKSSETLLGMPHPFIVSSYDPDSSFDYEELYYWDSYFIAQGLLDNEHKKLVTGILEDLLFLFERYKIIPNGSRTYLMGRSQPPFLTSFIFDVYDTYHLDKAWLKRAISIAQEEYEAVWMGTKKPNDRQVYRGLSRYYDINMLHDLAEAESGWDMTPRFHRRALNYLPVDLNALLYKYEVDFVRASDILGDSEGAKKWQAAADARAKVMNELMWEKNRGLFVDYNYVRERKGAVASLAAYFPMWAGMVTKEQAAALVKSLTVFEFNGGLSTTAIPRFRQSNTKTTPTQWAYPNGWAPLHFIVVQALERYGYHAEAKRIAQKWLHTNLVWFEKHNEFLEKYNVVSPSKPPVEGVYPSQKGFGWTNAIFERFCRDYLDSTHVRKSK